MRLLRRKRPRVIHLAAFDRNVGDNALNVAIDRALAGRIDIERMELVANPFDDGTARRMRRADGVIFGGGGVIHSCSGGSSRKNRELTGTMWNMPLDRIASLRAPIALYAVGYNRFDGEPPPLPRMVDFFDVLDRLGALITFRNDESTLRMGVDLPALAGRYRTVPDPGLFARGRGERRCQHVLVQLATDRLEFRYPAGFGSFIRILGDLLSTVELPIVFLPHTAADAKTYAKHRRALERLGSVAPLRNSLAELDIVMGQYRDAAFTVSTRGHSQICSIGNGTPTFCFSTHPKSAGFMRSIGHERWTVDHRVDQPEVIAHRFKEFAAAVPRLAGDVVELNRCFDAEFIDWNREVQGFFSG